MAMTKKEQAEVEKLKQELSLLAALRWTEEVLPDVPVPEGGETVSGFVVYATDVQKCESQNFRHRSEGWQSWSQHGRPMYSTRLLALKALRYSLEREAALALARVDRQIAEEKAKTGSLSV